MSDPKIFINGILTYSPDYKSASPIDVPSIMRSAGHDEGYKAALKKAAEHLRSRSKEWIKCAEDNQHASDATSRVCAVELACQADIIEAL
jgi:hypothetical protein